MSCRFVWISQDSRGASRKRGRHDAYSNHALQRIPVRNRDSRSSLRDPDTAYQVAITDPCLGMAQQNKTIPARDLSLIRSAMAANRRIPRRFSLRGQRRLPLPRERVGVRGNGRYELKLDVPTRVAFCPFSPSMYLAYSAVCLFMSFVAFVGFCKMFRLQLRRTM